MHLLQVSPEVATLGEVLVAELARERSLTGVLPEVVSQVARLFKHAPTTWVHALEEQLLSVGLRVPDLDGLVPLRWDTLEMLGDIVTLVSCLWLLFIVWTGLFFLNLWLTLFLFL